MTIDNWLKIVQILFYFTVGATAVATFLKAKNGLLNAVNTEYQKRVMDRLAEISSQLVAEFDTYSDKHWTNNNICTEVVAPMNKEFLKVNEEVRNGKPLDQITDRDATSLFTPGVPISSLEEDLLRTVTIIKSDPFIPKKLRTLLLDYYQRRVEVLFDVTNEKIGQYKKRLRNDISKQIDEKELDARRRTLNNSIVRKLAENGFGISDNENRVNELRDCIQDYLEQFNSLVK